MSAKDGEYVDVTKTAHEGGYVDVTKDSQPLSKHEEAEAERNRRNEEDPTPPAHAESSTSPLHPVQPPSLAQEVGASIHALSTGDPTETISVPMIHSVEKRNYKHLFSSSRKTVSQTIVVRRMPREHYLKHYARDAEGNYVGTGKPAVDAGLVFVPGKSTPGEVLRQVREVAFGKMHYAGDFSAGATMLPFLGSG